MWSFLLWEQNSHIVLRYLIFNFLYVFSKEKKIAKLLKFKTNNNYCAIILTIKGDLRYSFLAKHPRYPLRWNHCRNLATVFRSRQNFFVVLLRPIRCLRRRREQPLPCRLRALLHLGLQPLVRLLRGRLAPGVDGSGNVGNGGPGGRGRMLSGGGGAVGDAEELVGNEVELLVDWTNDALDGFLNGADAGAVLCDGDGDDGVAHCGNFDGKLMLPCSLC